MRIVACGDIHCKPHVLENALKATKWDKFVFLGDACDDWGKTQEDNLRTIKTIIDIKKTYGDKFVWLLGNHDWGYYDDTVNMSGHIRAGEANVCHLLEENIDSWELFYSPNGKIVFSHAGLGLEFLNECHNIPYKKLKRQRGQNNPVNNVGPLAGGWSTAPSLIWARPEEITPPTAETKLISTQIVGHTPVKKITTTENGLVVCDTFSSYPDGTPYGDYSLLLIDISDDSSQDFTMSAINYLTGKELYHVPATPSEI